MILPRTVFSLLLGLVAAAAAANERGRALFDGSAPLRGAIAGQANGLPPAALRCVNCHGAGTASPAASAPFGPLLTRRHLTEAVARRGGPPSRYDAVAFCRLLRDGVDPAYVMVPRAMPRYDLPEADCRALWTLLTEPGRP